MTVCRVLLQTTHADLIEHLSAALEHCAVVEAVATPDEAAARLAAAACTVLVVDARQVRDGGHAADRLLEAAEASASEPRSLLITDAACPEPLERRAAAGRLVHLRGDAAPQTVSETVKAWAVAAPFKHDRSQAVESAPPLPDAMMQQFPTNSPALRRMLEELSIAAAHDVTILLIGETGAGKTYLSRLIHETSGRGDQPFLHVACGALPRELIESELFGHIKGAFTSAHADKVGKFLAAGGGTILLDEIDLLAPEQQVKLLRVIETREFEPVGSNETQRCRARLVVASNLDLQPLVAAGRFRPDLYYRLSMLKFEVPPLRQRRVDIVPLAKTFIRKFARQHRVLVQRVDDAFYELLLAYPWPGNVRELEHVVQRAVIYCRGGALTPEQLPPHIALGACGEAVDAAARSAPPHAERVHSLEAQVALTEKDLIVECLARNNHSRTRAAQELGISRVTLYNKMKRHRLMS